MATRRRVRRDRRGRFARQTTELLPHYAVSHPVHDGPGRPEPSGCVVESPKRMPLKRWKKLTSVAAEVIELMERRGILPQERCTFGSIIRQALEVC